MQCSTLLLKNFPPPPTKILRTAVVGQIVVRRTSMLPPPPPPILAVFMGVLVHNLSITCCLPSTPKYPDHPLLSRILSTFSKLDLLLLPIDTWNQLQSGNQSISQFINTMDLAIINSAFNRLTQMHQSIDQSVNQSSNSVPPFSYFNQLIMHN